MDLFRQILSIDSTSGKERELAIWIAEHFEAPRKDVFEVGDGSLDVLLSWGCRPEFVFCTHLDTVPPYIAPEFDGNTVRGRGSCDAKGQIFAMYRACRELEMRGYSNFALLLLSGEETGSWGAKYFAKTFFEAPYLIIGEPTENRMVSASKGTKSFDLLFKGEAFHSGYPQKGRSAVEMFVDFMNRLRAADFPMDGELGETTWNVGMLNSSNPQNILSPELSCRIYFRTTFASDALVCAFMQEQSGEFIEVTARGGDEPARYLTIDGLPSGPVAFGSDAPHLSNFEHKMICGPGSINLAHRDDESISLSEIDKAVDIYVNIFEKLTI